MITVNRHTLANGLRLVHHEDKDTQMVALNVLYNMIAKVVANPAREDIDLPIEEHLIVELYSK